MPKAKYVSKRTMNQSVVITPPASKKDEFGHRVVEPGLSVQFKDYYLETDDPKVIEFLDAPGRLGVMWHKMKGKEQVEPPLKLKEEETAPASPPEVPEEPVDESLEALEGEELRAKAKELGVHVLPNWKDATVRKKIANAQG